MAAADQKTPQPAPRLPAARRFEGAVLDRHGNETPITEKMIQQACRNLERQAQIGLNGQSPRPAGS